MTRAWLAAAALGGFLSLGAGAIAAHLTSTDPRAAELLRTGALYGMVHAAALTAVAAMAGHRDQPDPVLIVAGRCFVTGVFLFSFSLFAKALNGDRAVWPDHALWRREFAARLGSARAR
jgi:uncharacterized membrane protein YgdD (TMEM256/DUF423 family)